MNSLQVSVVSLSFALAVSFAADLSAQAGNKLYKHSPIYNVLEYHIKNDGESINTAKIQILIDKVADLGGGTIYFPPGKYLTGTFHLRSHINICLESGATIMGSLDINDYVPVGDERPNHSARQQRHLVYGNKLVGVSITGRGMIDGRGYTFWPEQYRTMTEIEIRTAMTAPDGYNTRPGPYVVLDSCTDVLIEGIQFKDSPHHMLKVLNSRDVTIRGISIEQGIYEDDGPNTDGLAVSGFNIRISDCNFTTGDDCLVIGNAEHLAVSNCTFSTTESAIVLNGLRNGVISNCSMVDAGSAFNFRPGRGGLVENVSISNINYYLKHSKGGNLIFARSQPFGEVRESVRSWAEKWNIEVEPPKGPPPVIRNILISDVVANSDGAIFLDGQEDGYIEHITFDNIRYTMRGGMEKPESENPSHPFYVFGHHTAPYGIFCRYVNDITLRDVKFTWNQPEKPEWGSPIRFENANSIEISGFKGRQSLNSGKPIIKLSNVNGAYIYDCQAEENTITFLEVKDGCMNVLSINNDLRNASHSLVISDKSCKDEVIEKNVRKYN